MELIGKKLLILGGVGTHCKIVNTAKSLGVYTIVTDYFDDSPAKLLADESWNISATDVDAIVAKCKERKVDAVLNFCADPTQLPYCKICEKLELPHYGTEEQFCIFSDKRLFKDVCIANGVDVISDFTEEDVSKKTIIFPVFVKPTDGRGSRGQSICYDYDQLYDAIAFAKRESFSGKVLIENYFGNKNSFQVTYLCIDGEPYVIRTADGYKGKVVDCLDRVALCSISPSKYTKEFLTSANEKFVSMLKHLGVKNGPVMAQGFYDNGVFRFFDPGLRFPGTDFECVYKKALGIDVIEAMIEFAFTGKMPHIVKDHSTSYLNGGKSAVLFPTISKGIVGEIEGLDRLYDDKNVVTYQQRCEIGEEVKEINTTKQRIAEIDILATTAVELDDSISRIQRNLKVEDSKGNDMIYKPFEVERIDNE